MPRRDRNLLPAMLIALALSGCRPGPLVAPTTDTQPWNWTMPLPSVAAQAQTTISVWLYAGYRVDALQPRLRLEGLRSGSDVALHAPDGSTVWRAVPGQAAAAAPELPGGAVRLAVSAAAGSPWPTVVVERVEVRLRASRLPDEGALRLASGETAAAWLDPADPAPQHLVKVPAVASALDLALDGPGQLQVAVPHHDAFVLYGSGSEWLRVVPSVGAGSAPSGVWTRIRADVAGYGGGVRLTWQAAPGTNAGVARLMPVATDAQRRLAFPSRETLQFFGHWFGVDRDGTRVPCGGDGQRSCDLTDKLRCTDHAGRRGLVDPPLGPPLPFRHPVCYDGHEGTDFGLRGGGFGQASGVDVTAAIDGVVLWAEDGHPDDCFYSLRADGVHCRDVGSSRPFYDELLPREETPANRVAVLGADGHVAWYYHLRRGSVAVATGQWLRCGDRLGQVGSSGNSSGPHLHFELRALAPDAAASAPLARGPMSEAAPAIDPFPDRWRSWRDGQVPSPACR